MTALDTGVIYQDVNDANIFFGMFNRGLLSCLWVTLKGAAWRCRFLLEFRHGCFGSGVYRCNNARAIATKTR